MQLCDLFEARRNPETSQDNRVGNGINLIKRYFQDEYFVSFTKLNKVGINPQSRYNTPLGIYAYQLDDPTIQGEIITNTVKFAGGQPYMNVLRINSDKVLQLRDMTAEDCREMNSRITDYAVNLIGGDDPDFKSKYISQVYVYAGKYSKLINGPQFVSSFWNYSRITASLINLNMRWGDKTSYFMGWNTACETVDNAPTPLPAMARWNHLLRNIGIDVIVDSGMGLIHMNEPIQTVFLTPGSFRVVDRIDNPRNVNNAYIQIDNAKDFEKMLKELSKNRLSENFKVKYLVGMLSAILEKQTFEFTLPIVNELDPHAKNVRTFTSYVKTDDNIAKCFSVLKGFVKTCPFREMLANMIISHIMPFVSMEGGHDRKRERDTKMVLGVLWAAIGKTETFRRIPDTVWRRLPADVKLQIVND